MKSIRIAVALPAWVRSTVMAVLLGALCHSPAAPGLAGVERVIVVGVDGLSPDGVLHADTPNLKRLREQGAWTFHARGVMPTSSSPNWASMIMGAGPEQHGVTSNDWEPDKFAIAPLVQGPGGIFPTIFSVLRQQQPASYLAVFHDWDGFARLVERKLVDTVANPKGPTNTMRAAIECLTNRRPILTFIQLDHVDAAGHKYGHGTAKYYAAVGSADRLIGELLGALDRAALRDTTVVLVTADHGGIGKHHGGATMREIEIPWIIAGPGVRKGHEIQAPVNTYDTAATLAYVFQAAPPAAWIAHPVREAFELENAASPKSWDATSHP